MKDIETHESQDQAHIEFSELYRERLREVERLKQLYKPTCTKSKIKTFKIAEQDPIYITSISDKAPSSTTCKSLTSMMMINIFNELLHVVYKASSKNSICAWSWLSCVSMSFKNYSLMPGSIMFSSPGCLEGVTDI